MFKKILFCSLLGLLMFACEQDSSVSNTENTVPQNLKIQLEQEVANRMYFLENHVNLVGLNTKNFPLVYQATFDKPDKDDQSKNSGCESCDYVPSNCNEFALYLNLLESGCNNGDSDNDTDFCALFENCSKCHAEECETPDPCLGVFCPQGFECEDGVCVGVDECERIEASYRELRNLTTDEWIEICNISNDGQVSVEEFFACVEFQEFIRLQWEYYGCMCRDLGYDDLCECLC